VRHREDISHALSTPKPSQRGTGLMAHPPGSGGTSLAPTPTHPHHLSRETSRDELEMAESLRLLNQGQERHKSRIEIPLQEHQPMSGRVDQRSEIYHSLEDAIPISDGPATQATSTSLQIPHMSFDGTNLPVSGQVCRYVI
jgi:GATA-binding protein